MNRDQTDYILKNYKRLSVNELSVQLKLDRKVVQNELKRILSLQGTASASPSSGRMVSTTPPLAAVLPWVHWVCGAVLIALAFAVYFRSLSFPFLNWDDPAAVTENPVIRNFSIKSLSRLFTSPTAGLYIPVTILTYSLDYHFWHFNALGYHLTNVVLHAANALIVYGLLVSLTREWLLALAVSLLFMVHPVQIESVVWITERKTLFSSLLALLSFGAYARAVRREAPCLRGLIISVFLFLAACFAKPSAVALPFILIAFDFCYGSFQMKRVWRYFPYFAGAFLAALLTVMIHGKEGHTVYYAGTFIKTMRVMSVVMFKYIELLFFPLRQSLLYEFPVYPSFLHPQVALACLGLLAAAGGLFYLWRKNRPFFFWGAWYLLWLLPVMNLIPFPSLMNDRYLYLPLIGIFTLFFLGIKQITGRGGMAVLAAALVLFFIPLNLKRQAVWADSEKLWIETQSNTGAETGMKYMSSYLNLGDRYFDQGELDKAVEQYEKAAAFGEPMAFGGLGLIAYQRKDLAKAEEYYLKGISLIGKITEPALKLGFFNGLALVYKAQGRLEAAEENFRKAIQIFPGDPKPYNNLGNLLSAGGKSAEAERAYLQALEIDPDFGDSLYLLGMFYLQTGRAAEARKPWARLLEVHPDYPKIQIVKDSLEQIGSQS